MAADYTTLADVKDWAGIGDTQHDARLSQLITAASRVIDGWCKAPAGGFVAQTEARIFDVPAHLSGPIQYTRDATLSEDIAAGSSWASTVTTVPIDPLLGATAVQTDPGGDQSWAITWAATDYDLLPTNAPLDGYPYRQIRATPNSSQAFILGQRTLKITGTWGLTATLPNEVQVACNIAVRALYERRLAPYGMTQDAGAGAVKLTPLQVDPHLQSLLGRWLSRERWFIV